MDLSIRKLWETFIGMDHFRNGPKSSSRYMWGGEKT